MKPYEKHGIEIDVCPGCRGVWLDRGELEKLLEVEARSSSPLSGERGHEEGHGREEYGYEEHRERGEKHGSHGYEHGGHDKHDKQYGHQGRRKSLLGDLFGGFGGDD
jgi:Zn-finger nucleic acid-binding protein